MDTELKNESHQISDEKSKSILNKHLTHQFSSKGYRFNRAIFLMLTAAAIIFPQSIFADSTSTIFGGIQTLVNDWVLPGCKWAGFTVICFGIASGFYQYQRQEPLKNSVIVVISGIVIALAPTIAVDLIKNFAPSSISM